MTTRQLSLKRSVYDIKLKNEDISILIRNHEQFLSMIYGNLSFLKEVLYIALMIYAKVIPFGSEFEMVFDSNEHFHNSIMYWKEKVPSDIDLEICCISFISLMVQSIKKENRELINKPIYTFLTKEVLPEMWKDRKEIELKRQRKLESLAKLLDKDERYQEAHVIRIIIKPHLEEMNRKWANMTALEKVKSLFS